MSGPSGDGSSSSSRFTSQGKTAQERLSSNTVGLVALSDFRKRRAEVAKQQEREAHDLATGSNSASGAATPNTTSGGGGGGVDGGTATPDPSEDNNNNNNGSGGGDGAAPDVASDASSGAAVGGAAAAAHKKKKRKLAKSAAAKLSFGGDEDEDEDEGDGVGPAGKDKKKGGAKKSTATTAGDQEATATATATTPAGAGAGAGAATAKFKPNAALGVVPRALTKAALRREATERETLRREFLARQEVVKASEIAVPFVFYDGSNIPGGVVRVKKGDFVWVFLDKSRKVGADRSVGEKSKSQSRKEWARIGVDDLLLVRGNVIIPHHYDFLYFIMNKTAGPGEKTLFDYRSDAPADAPQQGADAAPAGGLSAPGGGGGNGKAAKPLLPDISTLEGYTDDPSFTKVVDRRWYERNKHIYPSSMWQAFDPEKDYSAEVRRDTGGNTFFYS